MTPSVQSDPITDDNQTVALTEHPSRQDNRSPVENLTKPKAKPSKTKVRDCSKVLDENDFQEEKLGSIELSWRHRMAVYMAIGVFFTCIAGLFLILGGFGSESKLCSTVVQAMILFASISLAYVLRLNLRKIGERLAALFKE